MSDKCDRSCVKNKKWDISRVCCAVKVALLWKRDPASQESHYRLLAAQIGAAHAAAVRVAAESAMRK